MVYAMDPNNSVIKRLWCTLVFLTLLYVNFSADKGPDSVVEIEFYTKIFLY